MVETKRSRKQDELRATALSHLCSVKCFPHFTNVVEKGPRAVLTKTWSGPPHPSLSNGALKPPRGSYLQREELSRTFQPTGTLWLRLHDLSLAPAKTAALRLSDRALISDHRARWTINPNLNQGHHHQPLLQIFWHFLRRNSYQCFYHEQACTKNRVERFHRLHCLSPLPQASAKRDRRGADRASFNTLSKKKERKKGKCPSCPSEKCEVNEIRHAEQPPPTHYVKNFDWGGLKAHHPQTTTPNPLPTLQETVSLCPDRPPR